MATADGLQFRITGSVRGDSAGAVTVDDSQGDPLPPSGLFADTRQVILCGTDGGDTVLTTSTTAVLGNATLGPAEVRFNPGTLVAYAGGDSSDTVIALAGNLTLTGDGSAAGPAVVVNTAADVWFDGTQSLSSLTVLPGGLARVQQDGTSVLTTYGLSLSPATTAMSGGIVDLADNDIIVKASSTDTATNAATLSTITGWLADGYDSGKWDDLASTSAPAPAAIISTVAGNDSGVATLAAGQGTDKGSLLI